MSKPPKPTPSPAKAKPAKPGQKPEWAPHMWEGCDFFAWIGLLARNRFAVAWCNWWIAGIITFVSFWHTFLRLVQDVIYGPAPRRTAITQPAHLHHRPLADRHDACSTRC